MKNFGLGLVGATLQGGFLLTPTVVDAVESTGLRLRAIHESDYEIAREVERNTEYGYGTHDLQQSLYLTCDLWHLFNDFMLDILLITAPAAEHRDLVAYALSGKDKIALQAPLAANLQDAQAIVEASCEKPILVNLPRRFDAGWQKAYELLQSGIIGKLQFINLRALLPETNYLRLWERTQAGTDDLFMAQLSGYMDVFNWFAGAPCVQIAGIGDDGAHDLDDYDPKGPYQGLFRQLPLSWRVKVSEHSPTTVVDDFPTDHYLDHAALQMLFGNQVIGTLNISSSGPTAQDAEDLELVGEKGRIWFNAAEGTLYVHFFDGSASERIDFPGCSGQSLLQRYHQAFVAQFPDYIEGAAPAVSAVEAADALELVLGALESIHNNGMPVQFDFAVDAEPLPVPVEAVDAVEPAVVESAVEETPPPLPIVEEVIAVEEPAVDEPSVEEPVVEEIPQQSQWIEDAAVIEEPVAVESAIDEAAAEETQPVEEIMQETEEPQARHYPEIGHLLENRLEAVVEEDALNAVHTPSAEETLPEVETETPLAELPEASAAVVEEIESEPVPAEAFVDAVAEETFEPEALQELAALEGSEREAPLDTAAEMPILATDAIETEVSESEAFAEPEYVDLEEEELFEASVETEDFIEAETPQAAKESEPVPAFDPSTAPTQEYSLPEVTDTIVEETTEEAEDSPVEETRAAAPVEPIQENAVDEPDIFATLFAQPEVFTDDIEAENEAIVTEAALEAVPAEELPEELDQTVILVEESAPDSMIDWPEWLTETTESEALEETDALEERIPETVPEMPSTQTEITPAAAVMEEPAEAPMQDWPEWLAEEAEEEAPETVPAVEAAAETPFAEESARRLQVDWPAWLTDEAPDEAVTAQLPSSAATAEWPAWLIETQAAQQEETPSEEPVQPAEAQAPAETTAETTAFAQNTVQWPAWLTEEDAPAAAAAENTVLAEAPLADIPAAPEIVIETVLEEELAYEEPETLFTPEVLSERPVEQAPVILDISDFEIVDEDTAETLETDVVEIGAARVNSVHPAEEEEPAIVESPSVVISEKIHLDDFIWDIVPLEPFRLDADPRTGDEYLKAQQTAIQLEKVVGESVYEPMKDEPFDSLPNVRHTTTAGTTFYEAETQRIDLNDAPDWSPDEPFTD